MPTATTAPAQSRVAARLADACFHDVWVIAAAVDGMVVVTVTTVVHVHNGLGRLYMVPVAPMHRVIARTMVQAIGRAI